jgi:serine/threonine protein kinase
MVAPDMIAALLSSHRPVDPQPGSTIADRFRLVREIARGGMGVVFEARHVITQRVVALKFVPHDTSDQRLASQRIEQEARALGACRHPSIVDVVDAGIAREIGAYLAMEMLEGRTLDGILAARKTLLASEAFRVAGAIGAALSHAHGKGVVHRDVKPSNIFVARDESIKLIDFGIAGSVKPDHVAPPSGRITRGGDMLGTLDYVPPEQLSAPDVVNPRSDQYALATTLLECLTGGLPSLTDRLAGAARLPRLSEIVPDLPREASDAIVRAMSPIPANRFESIDAFLAALFQGGAAPGPEVSLLRRVSNPKTPAAVQDVATRRKHARAPYITPCRVVRSDGSTIDGRSEDISEGGILIVLPVNYRGATASGSEQIQARFALPTTVVVATVSGTVRWLKDGQGRAALGVMFDEPGEVVRKSIATYVRLVGTEAS